MYKYILKRLILVLPVLLGVTFIVFAIMNFTPGDAVSVILGVDATEEERDQLRAELGLDKPFLERYVSFVVNGVRGDFGASYRTKKPVVTEVAGRFPTTMKLAFFSIFLAVCVGVPLGITSAVKQYSFMDYAGTVTAMFFAAVPAFWLGLMMILLFSLKLGWLPSNGIVGFKSYILPAVSLALPTAATFMRFTRSTMLETIRQDYIKTARAKGAPERVVIWKHALGNALLPIITSIGMQLGVLMGGTVIIETVYAIPGVGTLVITAIKNKDIPLAMFGVMVLSGVFCLIMLAVDIFYASIDPRVKARYTS